jgi:hypothetical protein
MSSEEGGGESLPELQINKPCMAREAPLGVGGGSQQPGDGNLVRVAEGGKFHRRGGKTHFPSEL